MQLSFSFILYKQNLKHGKQLRARVVNEIMKCFYSSEVTFW